MIQRQDIKYCYRARDRNQVKQATLIDHVVKAQNLGPLEETEKMYSINESDLDHHKRSGLPVRLLLRGGEVIRGRMECIWRYNIKLELETRSSLVVFRHTIYLLFT